MTENFDLKITVVIPTYNRSNTIVKAIESIQNQSYPVDEIIIVDDSSTDDTKIRVQAINDDRIRYFFLEQNRGAAGARNYGVAQARNDMIAFLDSDDVWHTDKIEKQVAVKREHAEFRLIYSAYVRIYNDSSKEIHPDMSGEKKLDGDMLSQILFENTVGTPTILMEKKLFEEIDGFDDGLRSLEDWDMVIRASQKTKFGFVPEVLVDAPYMDNGVTANINEYFRSRCLMMQKYRQEYLSTGTFNQAAGSILALAQKFNMLESVQVMLLQYISS